jgi:hypothetical protein
MLDSAPGTGELDQIEERLKRTVDEFYPLAEKRHIDALKDALVAAVRGGGEIPGGLKARVERLEADVAFLARYARLRESGHATSGETAHFAAIAERTERWSEGRR